MRRVHRSFEEAREHEPGFLVLYAECAACLGGDVAAHVVEALVQLGMFQLNVAGALVKPSSNSYLLAQPLKIHMLTESFLVEERLDECRAPGRAHERVDLQRLRKKVVLDGRIGVGACR
jgi:hypothetical protein